MVYKVAGRAVDKITDSNDITTEYIIQYDNGNLMRSTSSGLKYGIKECGEVIYNLDITSDSKLIQINRYDILGMTVLPRVFFNGKFGKWDIKHLNERNYILCRDCNTGRQFMYEYAM